MALVNLIKLFTILFFLMFFDEILYYICTLYLLQNNAVTIKGQSKGYLPQSLKANTMHVRFIHTNNFLEAHANFLEVSMIIIELEQSVVLLKASLNDKKLQIDLITPMRIQDGIRDEKLRTTIKFMLMLFKNKSKSDSDLDPIFNSNIRYMALEKDINKAYLPYEENLKKINKLLEEKYIEKEILSSGPEQLKIFKNSRAPFALEHAKNVKDLCGYYITLHENRFKVICFIYDFRLKNQNEFRSCLPAAAPIVDDYLSYTIDDIQKDYNNFKEKENLALFNLKENFSKANLDYLALVEKKGID